MIKFRYLPNLLTLLRLLLSVVFVILLVLSHVYRAASLIWPLTVCFVLIAATDLLDGWAARHLNAATALGAVLDVTADAFFILSGLIVHNLWGALPVWFTAVVLLKLIDFLLTSRLMKRPAKSSPFLFDVLGRAAAVCFFAVPYLVLLPFSPFILYCLLLFITGLSLSSSCNRLFSLLSKNEEFS